MPSDEPNQSPDYALVRALVDALLGPLTEEELEEGRRDYEANVRRVERTGFHLSVRPAVEVDPRVGRMPVRPADSTPTGGDGVVRPTANAMPKEKPADEDDDEDCCESCGELGTVDGIYCEPCLEEMSNEGFLECPFCHQSSSNECAHLVFGQDSSWGWVFVPAAEDELPCLDDDNATSDSWGDGEIQATFGGLAPLLDHYETPRSTPDDLTAFYEHLAALLTTPVVATTGIGTLAVYSEHDRDAARAEVETILGRLAEGFERLTAARRTCPEGERHDDPRA